MAGSATEAVQGPTLRGWVRLPLAGVFSSNFPVVLNFNFTPLAFGIEGLNLLYLFRLGLAGNPWLPAAIVSDWTLPSSPEAANFTILIWQIIFPYLTFDNLFIYVRARQG
jgi:hypothetical protein